MMDTCKVQARKALKIRNLCHKRLLAAVDAGTLTGQRGHDKAHFLLSCVESATAAHYKAVSPSECHHAWASLRDATELVRMANRSDRAVRSGRGER